MSGPLRIEFPGAYYHVMNRGLAYQAISKTYKDRETFLVILGSEQGIFRIHARQSGRGYESRLLFPAT